MNKKIKKPNISSDFTIEDIHKIREYNYELTKNMSSEKRAEFYNDAGKKFDNIMASLRKNAKKVATL